MQRRNNMTAESLVDSMRPYLSPDSGSFEDARQNLIQMVLPYEHEPWRRHHNLIHLREMIDYLAPVADSLNDPTAVFGAVLGHDSNYEPWLWNIKGANEELSRVRSEYFMSSSYSSQRIRKIGDYILSTVAHSSDLDDPDLSEFLDADMGVLGANEERNQNYADTIMEEYVTWGGLPLKSFLQGRITFLKNLDTRQIYITERAQDLYESQAHRNIGAEVVRLEATLASL